MPENTLHAVYDRVFQSSYAIQNKFRNLFMSIKMTEVYAQNEVQAELASGGKINIYS
jgi:hypothetical protein